jgi:hypothetical protein
MSESTKLRLRLLAAMLALIAGIVAAVVAVDLVRTVLS